MKTIIKLKIIWMQYGTGSVDSVSMFMISFFHDFYMQIVIVMHVERNPAFAISRMVFACARKDTVVLDATNASQDITAIRTVYHATVAPLAHPASVAIPQESVRASPILPEGLVVSAVQDITNIQNALVCNTTRVKIFVIYDELNFCTYFIILEYFNNLDTF